MRIQRWAETNAPLFQLYHRGFSLWRWLSDDGEKLMLLKVHFLLPACPERRGHAMPHGPQGEAPVSSGGGSRSKWKAQARAFIGVPRRKARQGKETV